jgi:hypothetical protein
MDVFKGDVPKNEVLIVATPALTGPFPGGRESLRVDDSPRDKFDLQTTGIHTEDGPPVMQHSENRK